MTECAARTAVHSAGPQRAGARLGESDTNGSRSARTSSTTFTSIRIRVTCTSLPGGGGTPRGRLNLAALRGVGSRSGWPPLRSRQARPRTPQTSWDTVVWFRSEKRLARATTSGSTERVSLVFGMAFSGARILHDTPYVRVVPTAIVVDYPTRGVLNIARLRSLRCR